MVTFIRKSLLNAYTALPLVMCLLIASWSTQAKPLTTNHRYSGEEMFRGLFFGEGRYAQVIPEIQSQKIAAAFSHLSTGQKTRLQLTRQTITERLFAQDKLIFDKFRVAMESNNPLLVRSMLEQTQGRIGRLINDKSAGKSNLGSNQGSGLLVLIITSESAANMSIQVIAMVAVEEVAQGDSKLLTEQLVASICHVSANPS